MLSRLLLSTLVIALVVVTSMSGQSQSVYYVRAGATGTASGHDWNNAFPALPSSLQRGATYYVADGTYPRRTFSTPESGTSVITIRKATASGSHTSVPGWSAAFGDGQATFTNGVRFTTGYYLVDGVNGGGPADWNCTHCGFKFQGTSGGVKLLQIEGSSHITVQHVDMPHRGRFENADADDIVYAAVGGCEAITVRYSYLHDSGRAPVLTRSCRNFLFEYNKVARNESTSDQHAQGWSGIDPGGHVIRYNLFEDIEGTSVITLGSESGCTNGIQIYGNIFWARPPLVLGWGNGVIGTWTGYCTSNWKIHNNTFVNFTDPGGGRGPKIFLKDGTGHSVQNNIWVNNAGVTHVLGSSYTLSHNSYYNTAVSVTGTSDRTGLTSDPLVDWRNENFRLRGATDPGVSIAAAAQDMLGLTRGADGTWDRGALENGGLATSLAAPTNVRIVR